jgi:hypothetical protein
MKKILKKRFVLLAVVSVTLLSNLNLKAASGVDDSAQDPAGDTGRHSWFYCFLQSFTDTTVSYDVCRHGAQ